MNSVELRDAYQEKRPNKYRCDHAEHPRDSRPQSTDRLGSRRIVSGRDEGTDSRGSLECRSLPLRFRANGKVGRTTVGALRRAGAPVRAVVRTGANIAHLTALGCEVATAYLRNSAARTPKKWILHYLAPQLTSAGTNAFAPPAARRLAVLLSKS